VLKEVVNTGLVAAREEERLQQQPPSSAAPEEPDQADHPADGLLVPRFCRLKEQVRGRE
jgi:hypothetical protein